MQRDVLPFRASEASRPGRGHRLPDVAVAALPLLRRLRDVLRKVTAHRARPRHRWGVPDLFFFNPAARSEWEAIKPAATPDHLDERAAYELGDLVDEVLTLFAGSVEVRRAARVVPGLRAAAECLAPAHPKIRLLADVMAIPDDLVVLVLHPAARAGFRVRLRGVADLFQFHILLADTITGSPARGFLAGPRPDEHIAEAYRDTPPDADTVFASARFQIYRPNALTPDGLLPVGFAGADQWLWGHEAPAEIPVAFGERIVLLGDPIHPRFWPVERRVPLIRGDLDLIDVLDAGAVADWFRQLAGPAAVVPRRQAA